MYQYRNHRSYVFTEDGQLTFLKIRDNCKRLGNLSQVFTMDKALTGCSGDSWSMMACVDRLAEIGEIKEVLGHNYYERIFYCVRV